MPDWTRVQRPDVLAAIAECDRLGSREFLSRYSFGRSRAYTLWHDGQEYDSKAILGVAYLHATGQLATRQEIDGDLAGAVRVLQALRFDIVVDEEALEEEERRQASKPVKAPAAPRAAAKKAARAPKNVAAKTARAKPIETPVNVCPNCHMAIPATGVCDFCD